jgi:hypothetical protein
MGKFRNEEKNTIIDQYCSTGGAGNYYVPKDLEQKGQFSNAHRSHILGDGTAAPEAAPVRLAGRGGAGNFAVGQAEAEEQARKKKLEEEQLREEKVKADVAKDVSENIAVPEKAKTFDEKQGL